ncbi:methionine ABC transporter permease MetI [Candidatus Berkiella aquae]|uniref:ABC transporter permease n=2 Tax=Candidatus Berkiella aquae TaxID=295108 RepID=A0A0Q9YID3_9GAMM|nr:methionine ABC transporter permease [Candidatus Berkiella aquae]MCS5711698.1 ABC transporter permease [Candidatus Berkiella aquae]
MFNEILKAFIETCTMVFFSGLFAALGGLPLGILLSLSRKGQLLENKWLNWGLGAIINAARSIPFIILMIAVIPLTRFLAGSSIQVKALIVPLTLAAIPFFARTVEIALNEVPKGLVEAAKAMGATPLQIIYKVLLPEAMSGIIGGLTLTLVNLVGFSAMAGFNGSGGLGKLAIDYGFYRYDTEIVLITVVIMIVLVQFLQSVGDYVQRKIFTH